MVLLQRQLFNLLETCKPKVMIQTEQEFQSARGVGAQGSGSLGKEEALRLPVGNIPPGQPGAELPHSLPEQGGLPGGPHCDLSAPEGTWDRGWGDKTQGMASTARWDIGNM